MAAERRSRNNTIIDCFAEETFEPGMTVSLVARRHGLAPDQLFTWRRLVALGGPAAAGSGEEVVPASDYRTLQNQVRELHRLLGKKTLQAEILKEALEHATGSKNSCGCRRRCRRTIPDEDRQRYRSLSLQPRGASAKAAWRRIRPPYRAVQHPFLLADLKRIAKAIGQQL